MVSAVKPTPQLSQQAATKLKGHTHTHTRENSALLVEAVPSRLVMGHTVPTMLGREPVTQPQPQPKRRRAMGGGAPAGQKYSLSLSLSISLYFSFEPEEEEPRAHSLCVQDTPHCLSSGDCWDGEGVFVFKTGLFFF